MVVAASADVMAEVKAAEDGKIETSLDNFVVPSANTGESGIVSGETNKDKPAAPATVFKANSESTGTLTGLTDTMTISFGITEGGVTYWTDPAAVSGTTMTLTGLEEGKIIRIVDHNSEGESPAQEITIKRQPSVSEITDSVTSTAVTAEDKNDGTISITPFGAYKFEYRLLTESDPQPPYEHFSVTPQTGLAAGTYLIRVEAAAEYLASSTIAVSVGSYTKPTKLTVPDNVAFEATGSDSGRLVNVGPTLRYSLGTSNIWVAITGDTAVIPSGVSGQILVKAFGDGVTTLDSDIKTIKISQYSAPDSKNLVVKDCSISTQNNGTVTVYYETPCEYRKEGFTTYTDVKDRFITNLTPGK